MGEDGIEGSRGTSNPAKRSSARRPGLFKRAVASTSLFFEQQQAPPTTRTGTFAGVAYSEPDNRVTFKSKGGPLAGAHARVEGSGDIHQRITATRKILFGDLAHGMAKRRDTRELYLTVELDTQEFVVRVDPARGDQARAFAARLNTSARRVARRLDGQAPLAPQPAAETQPSGDVVERLAQLAEMHERGVLNDDEFAAAKAKLLAP